MDTLTGLVRTHYCGELRESDIGKEVVVFGWVQRQRDFGQLIFINLRDRSGIVQLQFGEKTPRDIFEKAFNVRSEYVLAAKGIVRERSSKNAKIPTGHIEIDVEDLRVIAKAETTPFEIIDDVKAKEELRLKYRYLDLRRPEVQSKIIARHRIVKLTRDYFDQNGFIEIETPILIKSTPEGARDYLVPSRVFNGNFFALPQSPQLYKQLTMLAGFDRYMQIAKCFRDEDLRADRQPEFTQVDIEMSFVNQDDIINMTEGLIEDVFKAAGVEGIKGPFRRITYKEAMDRFGSDKPDTRFGLELFDITDIFANSTFEPILNVIKAGGTVRALKIPNIASYSRKEMDDIRNLAISFGAKGLAWITYMESGEVKSPMFKFLNEEQIESLKSRANANLGDVVFFVADNKKVVFDVLGRLRLHFGRKLDLIDNAKHDLLWVTDFPMFDYDEENKRYTSVHHPFTMVNPEDMDKMEQDPENCRSIAYDIIYNGNELGGGSVRIHSSDVQKRVFKALGFNDEQVKEKFGFMVEAFQYGTPPHAGIALGLDRLIALLARTDSIRDVIAFPKNSNAKCLMTDAPTSASEEQLRELHLKLNVKTKK